MQNLTKGPTGLPPWRQIGQVGMSERRTELLDDAESRRLTRRRASWPLAIKLMVDDGQNPALLEISPPQHPGIYRQGRKEGINLWAYSATLIHLTLPKESRWNKGRKKNRFNLSIFLDLAGITAYTRHHQESPSLVDLVAVPPVLWPDRFLSCSSFPTEPPPLLQLQRELRRPYCCPALLCYAREDHRATGYPESSPTSP